MNTFEIIFYQVVGAANINIMPQSLAYAIISIVIAISIFIAIKIFIKRKLTDLQGTQKLIGILSVAIAGGETIFLGTVFGLFDLAIEVIAYLGIGLWLLIIPFQNSLKNIVSGIGNYMNTDINIGDVVEIKGKRGVIIEFHLTKTILMTENGERVLVPNHRFSEDVTIVQPKRQISHNENLFKYI